MFQRDSFLRCVLGSTAQQALAAEHSYYAKNLQGSLAAPRAARGICSSALQSNCHEVHFATTSNLEGVQHCV